MFILYPPELLLLVAIVGIFAPREEDVSLSQMVFEPVASLTIERLETSVVADCVVANRRNQF